MSVRFVLMLLAALSMSAAVTGCGGDDSESAAE